MNEIDKLIQSISNFWGGVLSSIIAAKLIAIVIKMYLIYSTQARQQKRKRVERLSELRDKMASLDSAKRVEGYFIALFTLPKYLFMASVLWILTDCLFGRGETEQPGTPLREILSLP